MVVSIFDLFSIGIGPSSSHTVGPMRAATAFAESLRSSGFLPRVTRIQTELLGSLGATGKGHASDRAVVLGLTGERPESSDPAQAASIVDRVQQNSTLEVLGEHPIAFDFTTDLVLDGRRKKKFHPNAMTFTAWDHSGTELASRTSYSVGGGFVVNEGNEPTTVERPAEPYPFASAAELLAVCTDTGLTIAQVAMANESAWRPEAEVRAGALHIAQTMRDCVSRGINTPGTLPGGLRVRRRAPGLAEQLSHEHASTDPLRGTDWLTLYAMAVNEENANGGRVVTAPTNGAAGVIPAVLQYFTDFVPGANDDSVVDFLLTASAIGSLYKERASISGAEVGCQGEVGSASSMAAAAFAAVLGGTVPQVENAAEIAMEHHLGMTCDPIAGLVQIPCIERNGVAAVKAVTAARTALRGDGHHVVSLDDVIETMRATGADMKAKYKETSRGGLAKHASPQVAIGVNIIEC